MFEELLQIIGEILLQFVLEMLAEFGFHTIAEPFRKAPNPCLAALGYGFFGAVAGGLSLIVLPSHLVTNPAMRVANLIVTPIAVGLLMGKIGSWRAKRGEPLLRIDQFSYGYVFAVVCALVRFGLAQ